MPLEPALVVGRWLFLGLLALLLIALHRAVLRDLWGTARRAERGPSAAPREPRLVVRRGPGAGNRWLVRGTWTIGRTADNDLQLDHPTVSAHHARVSVQDGELVVEDLGSANGTIVNGARLTQPTVVQQGARIQVGECELQVEV
ncbi:MAG TPA: hypothetical protein DCZ72_03935 [Armatimonadetes bacterium]|nr:hypothetical protein [Armatimonadota bacterium]